MINEHGAEPDIAPQNGAIRPMPHSSSSARCMTSSTSQNRERTGAQLSDGKGGDSGICEREACVYQSGSADPTHRVESSHPPTRERCIRGSLNRNTRRHFSSASNRSQHFVLKRHLLRPSPCRKEPRAKNLAQSSLPAANSPNSFLAINRCALIATRSNIEIATQPTSSITVPRRLCPRRAHSRIPRLIVFTCKPKRSASILCGGNMSPDLNAPLRTASSIAFAIARYCGPRRAFRSGIQVFIDFFRQQIWSATLQWSVI